RNAQRRPEPAQGTRHSGHPNRRSAAALKPAFIGRCSSHQPYPAGVCPDQQRPGIRSTGTGRTALTWPANQLPSKGSVSDLWFARMPKGLESPQRTSRSKAPTWALIGRSMTPGQRSPLNSSAAVKRSPVASAGAVNCTTAATAWSVVTATGALPSLLLTIISVKTGGVCGGNSEGSTNSTSNTCTSTTAKRPADVSCLIVAETSASEGGDVTPPRAVGAVPASTNPKSSWLGNKFRRPGGSRGRSRMPRSVGRCIRKLNLLRSIGTNLPPKVVPG